MAEHASDTDGLLTAVKLDADAVNKVRRVVEWLLEPEG